MILVNGRRYSHSGERYISYYEVIDLAGYPRDAMPTVTYHSAFGAGTLVRDGAVEYFDGMTFTVAVTGDG
jgi:hypothetical protein